MSDALIIQKPGKPLKELWREKFDQLLEITDLGALTETDKEFLRARSSYLDSDQKEFFDEVLNPVKKEVKPKTSTKKTK